ncbi:hypothetical protein BHM03_00052119 [Ensete ventricosum]|nr:hypothetical protein BHM03_00052119 [Ensete ventricosum]
MTSRGACSPAHGSVESVHQETLRADDSGSEITDMLIANMFIYVRASPKFDFAQSQSRPLLSNDTLCAVGHLVRTYLPFALTQLRHHRGQNVACALLSIRTRSSRCRGNPRLVKLRLPGLLHHRQSLVQGQSRAAADAHHLRFPCCSFATDLFTRLCPLLPDLISGSALSSRQLDRCLFFLPCRCIVRCHRSQPLPPLLPRSRDPLPLLDSTLPHLPVAPTTLLAGVCSSTSAGLPQSTLSFAPILCTSPPATEAEQTQLFSHLFFAVQ